jgi:hypothetical protein
MAHNLETDIAKKVYYGILKQENGVEEEWVKNITQ